MHAPRRGTVEAERLLTKAVEASLLRLSTALLAQASEEWETGRTDIRTDDDGSGPLMREYAQGVALPTWGRTGDLDAVWPPSQVPLGQMDTCRFHLVPLLGCSREGQHLNRTPTAPPCCLSSPRRVTSAQKSVSKPVAIQARFLWHPRR